MPATELKDIQDFATLISTAGDKLIVFDFYSNKCGPCKMIAPVVDELADSFSAHVIMVKVNVEQNQEISSKFQVTALPTFIFMRQTKILERMQGADAAGLKQKIEAFIQSSSTSLMNETSGAIFGINKAIDLVNQIDKTKCECLNEDDQHPWANAIFEDNNSCLQSDCDEQLLIRIAFRQHVKLYGIKFCGVNAKQPNHIKIFTNQINGLDFEKAENGKALLEITPKPEDFAADSDAIILPKLKFGHVDDITLFISGNFDNDDVTVVRRIIFLGQPSGDKTDMTDFKRVSGKAGEGE